MKLFFPIFIIILLIGCYPINLEKDSDTDNQIIEDDQISMAELKPDDSKFIDIFPYERNTTIIKLTGMTKAGYYSVKFSHDPKLNIPLKRLKININRYEDYNTGFISSISILDSNINESFIKTYFKIEDTSDYFIRVYFEPYDEDTPYKNTPALLNVIFSFETAGFTDPFPDYGTYQELNLNTPIAGIFSRVIEDPEDYFEIKGLLVNQVYKLSIDYDYSDSMFNTDNNLPDYHIQYSSSVFDNIEKFNLINRSVCFFRIEEELNLKLSLRGSAGIAYTIFVVPVIKSFPPDAFEPDSGPISSASETIEDTGWNEYQSNSHTLIYKNIDWIKFIPKPDTTYQFYMILEDAYYDELCNEDFHIYIDIDLIKPDGFTDAFPNLYGSGYGFSEIPVTPIQSSGYITFENTTGLNENWFLKISSNYELKYSIKVIKSGAI